MSEVNYAKIDNAKDLDVIMPMYNIEICQIVIYEFPNHSDLK